MFTAEELFQNIVDKNHSDETVLTIVQGKGTLPREQAGRNIHYDDASLSNYKKVEPGDFIIHLRSFEGGLEMANEAGIVSPAYTILRCKKTHSSLFYDAYFHTDEFINHNLSKAVEGIRDGRQISYAAFKWLGIPYCDPCEQKKISDLLAVLNKRIAKQSDLVESLKKYKRGLLQVIFDDNTVDLFGEVKQSNFVKLSDILIFQNGINADSSKYGQGRKYISVSDILKNDFITYEQIVGLIDIDDITLEKYSVTYGDVLFQRSSETREDAGRSNVYLDKIHTATFGGFVIRGKKKAEYNPLYLKYALDSASVRKQIMKCAAGAQHINVSQDDLSNVIVNLPSMKVQDGISCFISHLDNRINFISQGKKHYQLLRTALLQQLFI